jgi:hypothetical protein
MSRDIFATAHHASSLAGFPESQSVASPKDLPRPTRESGIDVLAINDAHVGSNHSGARQLQGKLRILSDRDLVREGGAGLTVRNRRPTVLKL